MRLLSLSEDIIYISRFSFLINHQQSGTQTKRDAGDFHPWACIMQIVSMAIFCPFWYVFVALGQRSVEAKLAQSTQQQLNFMHKVIAFIRLLPSSSSKER